MSRSSRIAGVATDTIVESTRIMKKPMTIAQRAGHGLCPSGTPPSGVTGAAPGATTSPVASRPVTSVVLSSPATMAPSSAA